MCAELSSDSPLHFTHHIRSQGWESVPGPTSPLLHSSCFDTGGAPTCLSIIIVSPLPPPPKPPLIPTIHKPAALSLHILPQLRGILQLWTVFHCFTGHRFDSLMGPAERRTSTRGSLPVLNPFGPIFSLLRWLARCRDNT